MPYPVRLAAIDIGSNAMRLVIIEVRSPSEVVEVVSRREPVRLGEGAFRDGRIPERNFARAVEAMSSFGRLLEMVEVKAVRAVATSAVRDSANGGELVERVREETGLRIETISGSEEARLALVATRSRVELEGWWLMADLGGGSLEISLVGRGGIAWTESLPLGTVRLLDGPDPSSDAFAERVDALLEVPFRRLEDTSSEALKGLVAAGGNIEALAELAGEEPDTRGVSRLRMKALRKTTRRVAAMTFDQRVEKLGLRPDRADVIVPAGLIYGRVAERAEVEELVVPHVGVKEGVLLELIAAHSPGSGGLVTFPSHSDDEETDGGEG